MRRVLFICMIALSTAAFAKKEAPQPPEPDATLFRPDVQVFSSHIDFLYWRTLSSGLSYALKMDQPAWNSADTYAVGNYKNAEYAMDPGFRIALSYFRAPRYWEVWGMYTRMTSRGQTQSSPPTNSSQYLDSTWPTYTSTLKGAKSWIHLNYNVADLLVDRYFNPNPHFRLRLIGGVTGAWMDQNWTILYTDVSNNTGRVRNEWKFGGCGLRAGLYADWFWTYDIYVTVRGTFAALVGPYMNRVKETTTVQPSSSYNPSLPLYHATYRDTRAAGHLQMILGPSWQKNFDPLRVELFAGYEVNCWANVQEIYHSTGGNGATGSKQPWVNSSLLTLQGLTTRLTLDY